MTVLHVTNWSKDVTNREVRRMVEAVDEQLRRDVAPAWGVEPVPLVFAGRRALKPRPGHWVLAVVNRPRDPGDAGWHVERSGGLVYSRVFAAPCLKHLDPDPFKSVAPTLSHEAIETLVDPFCSYWADSRRGFLVAREACDPVEDDYYEIDGVSVSNFVLPAFFDPDAKVGSRLDHLGRLRRPFRIDKGGYWMQRSGTEIRQVTDKAFAEWKQQLKQATGSRARFRQRRGRRPRA